MFKVPQRGDIWFIDLDPTIGHEQAKKRPCLIISTNKFNKGASELVIVIPITSKNKKNPLYVEVKAPEGGLKTNSYIMPEQIRTISVKRLSENKIGNVSSVTLSRIEYVLKVLLNLK